LLTTGSTPIKIENEHEQDMEVLSLKFGQACFRSKHCECSKVTGLPSLYWQVIPGYTCSIVDKVGTS